MPPRLAFRLPALAVAALLAAGFGLCLALNLPGQLSFDSVVQLYEGRTGIYGNWHPPLMSWLLGVFDAMVPGTGLFVAFDAALLFGSLGGVLWLNECRPSARLRGAPSLPAGEENTAPLQDALPLRGDGGEASIGARATAVLRPRTSRIAVLFLAFCLITPQFLLYQGIVWKDVLFADLAIGGFVCLALAGEFWPRLRWRFALLTKGMVLLVLAALVRQNGAIVLPAGCLVLAWFGWTPQRNWRAALSYGLGAFAAASIAVVAIHSALALRVSGDASPTVQFRLLQFYDLIGALKAEPALALPHFDDDDPALERLMRSDGVALFTPERNDDLARSPALQRAYFASPEETIPEEWHALIATHPGLYLRVRGDIFRWVFLTPDIAACRPVYTGVLGPAAMMQRLRLPVRLDSRDVALMRYAKSFMGTPVFSHPAYAVLALLLLAILLIRGTPADRAMAALLVSAIAFTASFFVISIACDYRYLYVLDLATMVAAFHLVLDWRSAQAAVQRFARGAR